jgi:hypothetical protein
VPIDPRKRSTNRANHQLYLGKATTAQLHQQRIYDPIPNAVPENLVNLLAKCVKPGIPDLERGDEHRIEV